MIRVGSSRIDGGGGLTGVAKVFVDRRVWMLAVERTSDVHARDTLFNSFFLGSRKFAGSARSLGGRNWEIYSRSMVGGIELWGGSCRSLFLIAGSVNQVIKFILCHWLEENFFCFLLFLLFNSV